MTLLQTFPKNLTDLFNKFFADQCTPLNNLNKLPPFYLKTDKKLCNLSINENDISIIIRNLDPNKSYGWENLSVRIISFVVTLNLSIKGTLQEGKYSDCWKKRNVVPVHKKES